MKVSGSLRVGIPELDEEHREIHGLVVEAKHLVEGKEADADTVSRILDAMARYSEEHFRTEEALMERDGFPGFAAHRAEHLEFRKQTIALSVKKLAREPRVALELLSCLVAWWDSHIEEADQEYANFVASLALRGRAGTEALASGA